MPVLNRLAAAGIDQVEGDDLVGCAGQDPITSPQGGDVDLLVGELWERHALSRGRRIWRVRRDGCRRRCDRRRGARWRSRSDRDSGGVGRCDQWLQLDDLGRCLWIRRGLSTSPTADTFHARLQVTGHVEPTGNKADDHRLCEEALHVKYPMLVRRREKSPTVRVCSIVGEGSAEERRHSH